MRPSLLAGLCVGAATGAWMFAEYFLGLHDDPTGAGRWTGFLALVFPVAGAFWITRKTAMPRWTQALREGAIFGAVGGLVGGAAIYAYFAFVNPGFSINGQPVCAGSQGAGGFVGSLILGSILTLLFHAVNRRKGGAHGG